MFVRLNCPRCGENKPAIGMCDTCKIEDIMFCSVCHHYNHRYSMRAHNKIIAMAMFLFCIAMYGGVFF